MSLNPVDWAKDQVSASAKDLVSATAHSVESALADAVHRIVDEMVGFLNSSSTVNLSSGWWKADQANGVLKSVGTIAMALMAVFLLLAILHGLVAGDVVAMLRAALLEVPMSICGVAALVGGSDILLQITDQASSAVLGSAPQSLTQFFATWGSASSTGNPAIGGLLLAVALIAGFLVWIELLVRSSLLYFLIAVAPLAFAARVWPGTRTVWKKLCEIGLALIVSKFAIALSLALGAAALAGGQPANGNVGQQTGTTLNGQLAGATLLGVSCFTPFVLLKLLPVVEASLVAQGISRAPARGVQSTVQAANYAHGLSRMAAVSKAAGTGRSASSPAYVPSSTMTDKPGSATGSPKSDSDRPSGGFGSVAGNSGAGKPRGPGPVPGAPTPIAPPLRANATAGTQSAAVPAAQVYLGRQPPGLSGSNSPSRPALP